MIRKYGKLFALAIVGLLASFTVVSAKNLTVKEIGAKVAETEPDASYAIVIGSYVFSSNHVITTEEFMAASHSIDTTGYDNILDAMAINVISRSRDDQGEFTEWSVEEPILGDELKDSTNVEYVDLDYIGVTVNTDEVVDNIVKTANDAVNNEENTAIYNKYELSFNVENGTLTVKAKDTGLKLADVSNSNVVATLSELLKNDNYKSIKITEVVAQEQEAKTVTLAADATTAAIKTKLLELFSRITTLGDFTGKSYTVEFELADETINNSKSHRNSYTLTFNSLVDTNAFFENSNGATTYRLVCNASSEDEKCTVVLNLLDPGKTIGGLDVLSVIVNKALNSKLVSSVNLQLGNTYKNLEYTTTTISTSDIAQYINSASTYGGLAEDTFGKIIVTFNLKDGAVSKYDEAKTSEAYEFSVGSYFDIDKEVKSLATKLNTNGITVSEDMKHIIVNVDLTDITLPKTVTNVAAIANQLKTFVGDKVSKVTINGTEFKSANGDDVSYELRNEILNTLLGINKAENSPVLWNDLTLERFLNVEPFELTIETTQDMMPASLSIVDETSKKATYTVEFKFNNASLDGMMNALASTGTTYYGAEYTHTPADEETGVAESRKLVVDLKSIKTKLEDVTGTNLLKTFLPYAPLIKTLKVDGNVVTIDENIKTTLINILGVETLEELASREPLQVEVELKDLINTKVTQEVSEPKSINFTVEFKSSAIVEYNGEKTLSKLLEDGAEKVYLTEPVSVSSSGLTINKDFEIDGNGNTITGDIKVSGQDANLKLTDVELDGKISVTATGVTITGSKDAEGNYETVIKGGIDASGQAGALTIDSVEIQGTSQALTSKAIINASTGTDFVLKNSKIKYTGDDNTTGKVDSPIYSLMKIEGNATITGNEFDITKIKNPIEFKWTTSDKAGKSSSVDITGNTFTGDNYMDDADSYNVISVYNLTQGATVNIKDNTFEYANSMLRISNPNDFNVTFNVVRNHVEKYSANAKDNALKGLIVIRPNTDMNLSRITIKHAGNTFGPENKPYTTDALENNETRLVYERNKDEKSTSGSVVVADYVEPEA